MRNDLYQDERWTTRDGKTLALEDMTPEHRRNLLAMLRRRADSYKLSAQMSLAYGMQPSGDAACDAFDAMCDEIGRTPAAQWLEELPLVERLRELVGADAPGRRRRALAMPVPAGLIPPWRPA